ncbi:MAG: pteridine reductase [Gammaproteobacteria bacterium]|jgi:pteridine reductase|nr:pteridine reductase [Gammaproteobacteria bacterium]
MVAEQQTLDGKWALITGAGKRIGACIASTLHEAGAGIVIHYRDSEGPAEELANQLNSIRAGSAVTVKADLCDTTNLDAVLSGIVARTGGLDILVNNASSFYPTPLGSITEQHWDDLVGTNLKAPLFLSQAAEPYLRDSGGVIINIVDIHALRPLRQHAVYGLAKAGLAMLTRTLARDLAPAIRVNGVSPGAILWPDDDMPDNLKDNIIGQVPMKRAGEPGDIADCVLYLTRDAGYVTGQIIAVDGGRSIGW